MPPKHSLAIGEKPHSQNHRLPRAQDFVKTKKKKRIWLGSASAWVIIIFAGGVGAYLPLGDKAKQANAQPDAYQQERDRMVREEIEGRGVHDPRVLAAMRKVPRHLFVPRGQQADAYVDLPLNIGYGQTITQPYLVAFMTEALRLKPDDRVLEIGTGSGYQAAVLAELVREVYTIEIVEPLGKSAEVRLKRLGYSNVHVRIGDGYRGWPEAAPFDAIVLTAAPPERVPPPLIEQLREGGHLISPLGGSESEQDLTLLTRTPSGVKEQILLPVHFVPMTGETQQHERRTPN